MRKLSCFEEVPYWLILDTFDQLRFATIPPDALLFFYGLCYLYATVVTSSVNNYTYSLNLMLAIIRQSMSIHQNTKKFAS